MSKENAKRKVEFEFVLYFLFLLWILGFGDPEATLNVRHVIVFLPVEDMGSI
jgi:hypothetical protein